VGAVTAALAAVLTTGSAGAAEFAGSYFASANADGVRLTFIAPAASLSDTAADVAGPSAQATMDSIGTSRAFASFPYPGETAVTSTGLVRTLSGAPVPDYPLYANSDHPIVPSQQVGSGVFALRAESAARRSASTASVGLAVEGAGTLGLVRSTASTDATGEAVISEAQSVIEALSIGPLRLGHVVSTARVSLGPDGQLTRQSSTDVVGATVAGVDIAITPDGVKAGDAAAPLPAAPVGDALAGAGITVELVKAQDLPTGVAAPAVRITQEQKSGTKLIYLLGAATATAGGESVGIGLADGADGAAPGTATGDGGDPGSSTPGTTDGPSGSSLQPPPETVTIGETGSGADGGTSSRDATALRAPAGLVVPDFGSANPPVPDGGSTPGSELAGGAAPGAAAGFAAAGEQDGARRGARAAVLASVLGTGVDAKPVYGAFAIGGILGLALLLAMRGLSPGGSR
jgi:hypothetical protein